jgi:acetyl-CoA synthetase/acetyltransferase
VTSYIETMRDVDSIRDGLDALRAAGKPVLICAPEGRSEAARRSIVAHTGALAGDTALRDAWLRGHGAVLVEDPVTMFEAAVLLSHVKKLRTTGVAAALQSGGACTLFAEAAGAAGLTLPELGAHTKRTLKKALPSFASQNNPLDVTGQAAVETPLFEAALEALADDPSVGVVAFDAFPPRLPGEAPWAHPVLAKAVELQRRTGVAFVSVAMSPLAYIPEAITFTQRWKRLPFLQGHHASAGAIRALVDHQGVRGRAVARREPHRSRAAARRLLRGLTGPVDEATAAQVLALYGIRRPSEATASTRQAAVAAARRIGFPVAIKAVAPELPHKARLGGVRLEIENATDAEIAAGDVVAAARDAGAVDPRVLVQGMVSGDEVLVGAVVDERFGPLLTMRPGGALAEAGDATFVPCPLTAAQARRFVAEQAARCALHEDRHDLRAVAKAVEGIARAAWDLRDRIMSVEANPLLVDANGAIAVDALAEMRSS